MNEIISFLEKSGIQYFSTIGLDNKPKVRPFAFMLEEEGRLYFCTSNEKNVFNEMGSNPWVEICASGDNSSWLRLSGRVCFTDDLSIKAAIQEKSPLVKSIYKQPDNPVFEAFYLEEAEGIISDFSGNPPRYYKL